MRVVEKILALVRETVYPEGAVCLGCGRISDGECLCPSCRQELRFGEMLDSWERRDLGGTDAWSMRPHRGVARSLVLQLKHGACEAAARELAGLLREKPDYFPDLPEGTVVTWVPAPEGRIRDRYIDHGKTLAMEVARELGLPCRALLSRRGGGKRQASLDRVHREQNLKGAFVPRGAGEKSVLLVDDVLTTGTTARRCMEALRQGGTESILVLTATHALHGA